MGRMNPLNTFLSLATLLRVFGQTLLNGVVIGRALLITSQLKIYYLGKSYIKTIYAVIIFCLLVGSIIRKLCGQSIFWISWIRTQKLSAGIFWLPKTEIRNLDLGNRKSESRHPCIPPSQHPVIRHLASGIRHPESGIRNMMSCNVPHSSLWTVLAFLGMR